MLLLTYMYVAVICAMLGILKLNQVYGGDSNKIIYASTGLNKYLYLLSIV